MNKHIAICWLRPALLVAYFASTTPFPQASAQTAAPTAAECVSKPDSLDAKFEADNAQNDKFPVYRSCFADGRVRVWAIDKGFQVDARIYDGHGQMDDLTIWHNDSSPSQWLMVVAHIPAGGPSAVQTWKLNVQSGAPMTMTLMKTRLYTRGGAVKEIEFAPDGVSPIRVDTYRAIGLWDVNFYSVDGTLTGSGHTDDVGRKVDVVHDNTDASIHAETIPAMLLNKPDLQGIPLPSAIR